MFRPRTALVHTVFFYVIETIKLFLRTPWAIDYCPRTALVHTVFFYVIETIKLFLRTPWAIDYCL